MVYKMLSPLAVVVVYPSCVVRFLNAHSPFYRQETKRCVQLACCDSSRHAESAVCFPPSFTVDVETEICRCIFSFPLFMVYLHFELFEAQRRSTSTSCCSADSAWLFTERKCLMSSLNIRGSQQARRAKMYIETSNKYCLFFSTNKIQPVHCLR